MGLLVRAVIGSGALLFLALGGAAQAIPIAALHASNQGISAFGFEFDAATNTITLRETWNSTGPGIVQLSGLDDEVDYIVTKIITNSSGVPWVSFAQELLDPVGFADRAGCSAASRLRRQDSPPRMTQDGLSFAQGSLLPRTSTAFGSVAADEQAGRDFLDYFGGILLNGGVDTMLFAVRDNAGIGDVNCDGTSCPNQPFLLVQRPNARSVTEVAQPGSLLLLGVGLVGAAFVTHRRLTAR